MFVEWMIIITMRYEKYKWLIIYKACISLVQTSSGNMVVRASFPLHFGLFAGTSFAVIKVLDFRESIKEKVTNYEH